MAMSWSTNGYMSVFAALFEHNSHLELQMGRSLPLYAVLPTGGKSEIIGTLEVPAAKKMFLLHGNDPTKIASIVDLAEGGHVRPVNSNFPTYDRYVVASTSSLCFEQEVDEEATCHSPGNQHKRASSEGTDITPWKRMKYGDDDLLALALQCTVSGPSGVPRRPKHKVYDHSVTKLASAFKTAQPQIVDLCTVFVVPPSCAERYVYRIQTTKGENVAAKSLPKMQLVAALSTRYSEGFESIVREREEADEKRRQEAAITVRMF